MQMQFLDDVYRPLMGIQDKEAGAITKVNGCWVQVITPGGGPWYWNTVKHAELSPAESLDVIDRTVHEYRQHGVETFTWILGPRSKPANLEAQLLDRGFKRHSATIGMAIASNDLALQISKGFVIEELSASNFEDLLILNREIWQATEEDCDAMRQNRDHSLQESAGGIRTLICYKDGEPVGSAAYVIFANLSLHLIGGGVRPKARGIGVYRALLEFRAKIAVQKQIPVVTVHCLESTSAPICAHLGFHRVCQFIDFESPRQNRG